MTTDKRGVSAFFLERQLGLPRYETAWMILHKLRRAMVELEGSNRPSHVPNHWKLSTSINFEAS